MLILNNDPWHDQRQRPRLVVDMIRTLRWITLRNFVSTETTITTLRRGRLSNKLTTAIQRGTLTAAMASSTAARRSAAG